MKLAKREENRSLAAVGTPVLWGRDLGTVGAISAVIGTVAFAPMMGLPAGAFAAIAGTTGAVTGALIGAIIPRLLAGPLSRVPVGVLLPGGLAIGSAWGALVGFAGAWTLTSDPLLIRSAVEIAAVAGALQFGWWWLPYLQRRLQGKSPGPLLIAASLFAPALGWAGMYLTSLFY